MNSETHTGETYDCLLSLATFWNYIYIYRYYTIKRCKVVYFHGYKSYAYAIHWRDVKKPSDTYATSLRYLR
jgi:hypothetical protein